MKREPLVWGRVLLPFLTSTALERVSGVTRGELDDPERRVPLSALYATLEAHQARGPLTVLELAAGLPADGLDALGLALLTARTLGDALDTLGQYQRLFGDGLGLRRRDVGAHVLLQYEPWGPARAAHRALAELFVRDLIHLHAQVDGGGEVHARLRHPVTDVRRHARLLGVEAQGRAPVDEVIIARAALARPFRKSDERVHAFLTRLLDAQVARLPPASPVARVTMEIERGLRDGTARLPLVAKRLGVPPRTLQRWLEDDGTSFLALLDGVRRALAVALVDDGQPLAEVSWLLGFSEPRAFTRAFTRWTGQPPGRWRR